MNLPPFLRRFLARGVFWRQALNWGAKCIPYCIEPPVLLASTIFFYSFLTSGRRAAVRNLRAILPGSTIAGTHLRAFRMFWNFACTINDTARFNERGDLVDWEFDGLEHFERLVGSPEGAIILTAHMGNYDLGSYLFARRMNREITIIRAPEADDQTQEYVSHLRQRVSTADGFRIEHNTDPQMLALDLIGALREKQIIAIQGDRVTGPVTAHAAELFGRPALLPSGPFALAMATGALIYPLFVIRVGWKRYRVTTCPPIECRRTGRDRSSDLERAVHSWVEILQDVIRKHPHQWFMFEAFERSPA